jgi:hypothetical protein
MEVMIRQSCNWELEDIGIVAGSAVVLLSTLDSCSGHHHLGSVAVSLFTTKTQLNSLVADGLIGKF